MDTKKYTIVIEGIKESIEGVKSLKSVIESVTEKIEVEAKAQSSATKEEKAATESKKERKQVTDELSKVQEKLTQFDKEYALEVARAKSELKAHNDEVKKTIQAENDLKVIEEQTLTTYRDKQNYLTSLNRTIRQMSDEDIVAGKSKEQLMKISEAVQMSLKSEDSEMAIYVRNVGNYASAVDGFADHMEEVSMSLDDIITAITNGGELDFNVPIESAKSLETQLGELKNQMAQMLADGVSRTDAAFLALAERAGQLKDAINDSEAAITHFASDTSALDNVVNLATTATASYGLLTSTMSMFGIENEEVAKSIEKLQAVQTALNSLQSLSASLCNNSTMSYQLYHKALQAVGLEKTKLITQTGALATAEGAGAAAATTAATATGSFAAALWAALAPLLVIVAIVGAVAAGIYGLVKAYEWLFGPTAEETKAMEAQTQAMMQLNAKTQENIELLQSKGATEAQVLKESIQNYQDNIKKLDEYLQKCKDFYGEDSDEYKKALEEKQKVQDSFDKANLKGLQYLNKVRAKYRDEERKRTIGEVAFKKEKAKEEFDFQVQLMEKLIDVEKIGKEEAEQIKKELEAAYDLTVKMIDEEQNGGKTSGTGGTMGESDAEKAAKEFKKAAKELTDAVEKMQETTTNALIAQKKRALSTAKELSDEIEITDKKSLETRLETIEKLELNELQIINASNAIKVKKQEDNWREIQNKYKGHTELLKKYQEEHETQMRLLEDEFQSDLADNERKYQKMRDKANEDYEKERLKKLKEFNDSQYAQYIHTADMTQAAIDNALNQMLKTEGKSLDEMQAKYQEFVGYIGDDTNIEKAKIIWETFWSDNFHVDESKFGGTMEFEQYVNSLANIMHRFVDMIDDTNTQLNPLQEAIIRYYDYNLKVIQKKGEMMREEGTDEITINRTLAQQYNTLIAYMGDYRQALIEAGDVVGDYNTETDALGNTIKKIPDGLDETEKKVNKLSKALKKFVDKSAESFKDTFDKMGESVNSVFDAINDWIQVDIDKIADALDEITSKVEEHTAAIEEAEKRIADLSEQYKTSAASDRAVIGQKIADEEALLAQEKAAQNAALQEQQRLDKEKQKLEKEQMKRQIEQYQFNAGISLINAIISTAEGMAKEYAKGIFGIPTAILIGVLGGIEVAAITAQIAALQAQKGRYANGGMLDADGVFQGPSHANGGIDVMVKEGNRKRIIEVEGQEMLINKRSTKKYYPLLKAINDEGRIGGRGTTITGLNQTKFANGGYLNANVVNDALESRMVERQMSVAMEGLEIKPVVSVVDIIKKTNDLNRVKTLAGR